MREIKTIKHDGLVNYMPYTQGAIETIQITNERGQENQKMSVLIVDVDRKRNPETQEFEIVSERVLEKIFLLNSQKTSTANIAKEQELAERELALSIKEEKLRKLQAEIDKAKKPTTK